MNTKDLVIIGAGNVGGFVAYNQDLFLEKYNILGFYDDDVNKIGRQFYGYTVMGNTDEVSSLSRETAVVIGIGSPKAKKNIHQKLADYGFSFPSFISKNVWLSKHVQVGEGVIIYPGVSINYETIVEDFVILNMNCAIGHNCLVSKYCTLAPGVNFAGFTKLEEGVDIGIGVSSKQNILVGAFSIVGGQSMLIKNVAANSTVAGVPAHPTTKIF